VIVDARLGAFVGLVIWGFVRGGWGGVFCVLSAAC